MKSRDSQKTGPVAQPVVQARLGGERQFAQLEPPAAEPTTVSVEPALQRAKPLKHSFARVSPVQRRTADGVVSSPTLGADAPVPDGLGRFGHSFGTIGVGDRPRGSDRIRHDDERDPSNVSYRLPVQRQPAWTDQHYDDSLDNFVTRLDRTVNDKADAVLDDPQGVPEPDGYLKRWKDVHADFCSSYETTGSVVIAANETPFLHAAYGYAVESLTNLSIRAGNLDSTLPQGWRISTQATRGHTRPDVVVKEEAGDLGWFDITASNSETHIFGKTGSGWSNNHYVAEVTYDSLDGNSLLQLLTGRASSTPLENAMDYAKKGAIAMGVAGAAYAGSTGGIVAAVAGGLLGGGLGYWRGLKAERARQERQDQMAAAVASERQRRQVLNERLGRLLNSVLDDVQVQTDMAHRRTAFEERLGDELTVGKLSPMTAKGLIGLFCEAGNYTYSAVANEAGYKGNKQKGRNREQALELFYTSMGQVD